MFSMFSWPIGRAGRTTMLLWLLLGSVGFNALNFYLFNRLDLMLELGFSFRAIFHPDRFPPWYLAVEVAFNLALVVVAIARLHDIERPGWWLLGVLALAGAARLPGLSFLAMVAILLWIALIFWPGTFGRNRYGKDPLGWESREQYEAQMQALRDHVRPGKESGK